MDKRQEAINWFKEEADRLKEDSQYRPLLLIAIEALEKQIPKKPIIESWCPALCPSCEEELSENLGDGYFKHWETKKICDCGQKLDWRNEDDL